MSSTSNPVTNSRCAVFILPENFRRQNDGRTVDYGGVLQAVYDNIGDPVRVVAYLTYDTPQRVFTALPFANALRNRGIEVVNSTLFRDRFLPDRADEASDNENEVRSEANGNAYYRSADDDGWIIEGGGMPKKMHLTNMAADIAAAAVSGRYDTIVLACSDSVLTSVLWRHCQHVNRVLLLGPLGQKFVSEDFCRQFNRCVRLSHAECDLAGLDFAMEQAEEAAELSFAVSRSVI